MLINHYKTTSDGLDELKKRNKVIILAILFLLVAFVYTMIWVDYKERKRAEGPSINQIVEDGGTWTIVNDEAEEPPGQSSETQPQSRN
jgi:hypothetical protein